MILYPPSPSLITKEQLNKYENKNFVAEPKLNGDRILIIIKDNIEFWTRHGYQFTRKFDKSLFEKELKLFNFKNLTILDGELIHFRTKNEKNKIFLFDIYKLNNQDLKLPFKERRKILENLFRFLPVKTNHILLIEQFEKNFAKVFEEKADNVLIEGLVIKNLNSIDSVSYYQHHTLNWLKIRKPKKNYRF